MFPRWEVCLQLETKSAFRRLIEPATPGSRRVWLLQSAPSTGSFNWPVHALFQPMSPIGDTNCPMRLQKERQTCHYDRFDLLLASSTIRATHGWCLSQFLFDCFFHRDAFLVIFVIPFVGIVFCVILLLEYNPRPHRALLRPIIPVIIGGDDHNFPICSILLLLCQKTATYLTSTSKVTCRFCGY